MAMLSAMKKILFHVLMMTALATFAGGKLLADEPIAANTRYGWFNGLDHRSSYGQGVYPEPFLVDDSDLETGELRLDARRVAEALWRDYRRGGRHDKPGFLKDFLPAEETGIPLRKTKTAPPKRQARHLI